jgi:hypothetical protein
MALMTDTADVLQFVAPVFSGIRAVTMPVIEFLCTIYPYKKISRG